jgi:hypothetical protein
MEGWAADPGKRLNGSVGVSLRDGDERSEWITRKGVRPNWLELTHLVSIAYVDHRTYEDVMSRFFRKTGAGKYQPVSSAQEPGKSWWPNAVL